MATDGEPGPDPPALKLVPSRQSRARRPAPGAPSQRSRRPRHLARRFPPSSVRRALGALRCPDQALSISMSNPELQAGWPDGNLRPHFCSQVSIHPFPGAGGPLTPDSLQTGNPRLPR